VHVGREVAVEVRARGNEATGVIGR
jgi:hypothetical protein